MKLPLPEENVGYGDLQTSINTINLHGAFNVGELINDDLVKINYADYTKEYISTSIEKVDGMKIG